ncbi:winged helix-turn-helix domain-containing protein [Novosphingobium sp. AP12]|uniref:ATP-binding protein n=1 Tax=Novosphingobium sp. AP12 TaxID=1144305 RepID=UPI000271F6CB|nr:winged helix-turn-helix domain-containing protein [Novosphingobium sp. AP12]EJL21279.1 putative ATPase [Novosphingobium sp. AP12]
MITSIDTPNTEYRFGAFRFIPSRHLLLHNDVSVTIGSRAVDLLHLLLARAGKVVTKDELLEYVWPGTHLHESNLKVNISSLRKALQNGDRRDFIATVPNRGYRFVAEVQVIDGSTDARLDPLRAHAGELPVIPDLIGRSGDVAHLGERLLENRLVTVVGPAGVGKTTLAVATARHLEDRFSNGIGFVDLAAIDDSQLVVPAIGLALGIERDAVVAGLIDALHQKKFLLLLDNCEHLLSAVATIAEQIVTAVPSARILATSREALHSRSEAVFRLAPLDVPAAGKALTAVQALEYPAIALFVRRAEEAHGYRFVDADAPTIAAICRRLDGLALAIELAVPQLIASDPRTLLRLIDRTFSILDRGGDSGPSRHQTLLATLDWSYQLLSPREARLFRLLSVFASSFSIEDILGVAAGVDGPLEEIAAWTGALVAKSLLVATYGLNGVRYRFLESTRSFAAGALIQKKEMTAAYSNYAHYFLALFENAEQEWQWRDRVDWTTAYAPRANDVRKAIDWAEGDGGDTLLAIRLTVAAIPLWDELSTVGESHIRVERALRRVAAGQVVDDRLKMKLMASYGAALNFSDNLGPEADATWEEGYRLARSVGSVEYQLRALWGKAVLESFSGRHRRALTSLDAFMDLATTGNERTAIPDGRRLTLMTRFYLGDIREALDGLSSLEDEYNAIAAQARMARFQVDRLVGIRVGLANAVWISGNYRRAKELAVSALRRAAELNHRVSQSNALAQIGLPLTLQFGELDLAREYVATLAHNLSLHETAIWAPVCRFYQGAIDALSDVSAGIEVMRAAVDRLVANNFLIRVPMYLAVLADAALRYDRVEIARTAVSQALSHLDVQSEDWCKAEILRMRGVLEWRDGDVSAAEATLVAAAQQASEIGALSFKLRAVTTLAELHVATGRKTEATIQLAPVYAQFDPDFASTDVLKASALLGEITSGAP